jgi:hypothetical protein
MLEIDVFGFVGMLRRFVCRNGHAESFWSDDAGDGALG